MDVGWPVRNLPIKYLIAIPLIIAIFFGGLVAFHWQSTGDPVPMSMDFAGGSFVRIEDIESLKENSIKNFESIFSNEFGDPSVKIHEIKDDGEVTGLQIETSIELLGGEENQTIEDEIRNQLSDAGVEGDLDLNIESMGSIITDLYKSQARNATIAALIAMAIILFIALRHLTTVGGIISVIGLDFIGILGGMIILNIPLSLASMAGILLIFGYAVNTNILLSTYILKRKGSTPRERAGRAMSTGIKMSSTSAAAMIALNLMTSAPELEQISAVLVIGILVDMVNTWLLNSGLILNHVKRKEEKYHARI